MGNEDLGESSRDRISGDDSERPLKKAKYVWQVKGKYHLKTTNYQNNLENMQHNTENNIKCDDENICTNNCVDTMLARTESILDELQSDDEDTPSRNIDKSISREIPVTLVSPNPENQDYYLRKWQARQMARSYIDNTINTVLESWASSSSPSTPFDDEDFVENCEDDGDVEDEGILMAIKSHGLQSTKCKKEQSGESMANDFSENMLVKCDDNRNNLIKTNLELKIGSDQCPSHIEEAKSEPDMEVVYPVDILNAAILVAIERKGLSSV